MTNELNEIKHLLEGVGRLWHHNLELRRLKGEDFNVFSILGLDYKENRTHSAMLGELLNPKGSHHLGARFLELFLAEVKYELRETFDLTSAQVTLEKHIGFTDYKLKAGGRIDIFIEDTNGNSISIENKIYAVDQDAQVERYVNYRKGKNSVYYLTLEGSEPEGHSRGELLPGEQFHCISYRKHVHDWLKECIKEAVDQPILRESLRQYQILIQKLTNQLSKTAMQNKVIELITSNYEAANLVYENLHSAEENKLGEFLNALKENLLTKLPATDGWVIEQQSNGLGISRYEWNGIIISIDSQHGLLRRKSYYGIFAPKDKWDRDIIKLKLTPIQELLSDYSSDTWWPYWKYVSLFENSVCISKLFNTNSFEILVGEISARLIELAVSCKDLLKDIPKLNEDK